MTNADDFGEEFLVHLAEILLVVADVGCGDLSPRLRADLPDSHPMATLYAALNKMVDSLDAERSRSAAYRLELEEKIATIDIQRMAIRDLSTPIIEVWRGALCLPVVGVLDNPRAAEMTEALLRSITETQAWCAIIDITGIQVIDTATADHFIRMAKAVRLLGAECVVTGINPQIAETIVSMGVDLSEITTHRSLRTALQRYVSRQDSAEFEAD